jgi:hypothetical protein
MTVKEPYGVILGIFSLVGFFSPVKCIHQLTRPGTLLTFLVSNLWLTLLQRETPPCSLGLIGTVFREADLPNGVLMSFRPIQRDAGAVNEANQAPSC